RLFSARPEVFASEPRSLPAGATSLRATYESILASAARITSISWKFCGRMADGRPSPYQASIAFIPSSRARVSDNRNRRFRAKPEKIIIDDRRLLFRKRPRWTRSRGCKLKHDEKS